MNKPKLPEHAEMPRSSWPNHEPQIGDKLSTFDVKLRVSRIGTVVAVNARRVTLEFEP